MAKFNLIAGVPLAIVAAFVLVGPAWGAVVATIAGLSAAAFMVAVMLDD